MGIRRHVATAATPHAVSMDRDDVESATSVFQVRPPPPPPLSRMKSTTTTTTTTSRRNGLLSSMSFRRTPSSNGYGGVSSSSTMVNMTSSTKSSTKTKPSSSTKTTTKTTTAPPPTPFSPLLVSLILMATSYVLPAFMLKKNDDLEIFNPEFTATRLFNSLAPLMVMIPLALYLQWSILTVVEYSIYTFSRASFTSYNQRYEPTDWWCLLIPTKTTTCFLLAVVLSHLKKAAMHAIQDDLVDTTVTYCQLGTGALLFLGWISALDDSHLMLYQYANHTDEFVSQNTKSQKWKSIVEGFGSWYNPSIDKSYTYPGKNYSAAYTLAEVMGVYVIIGKVIGLLFLVLWLIGVDLYQNIVIVGVSGLVAITTNALRINQAIGNLLPLAMSNTIHVGEIIAITRTGFTPGDDPSVHLTGLVEGFTWSHIVIRDFRKKQVYIPHSELEKMTISNWSRRPGKLFSFRLKVSPHHKNGATPLATLAKFVRDWINEHPEIEQTDYKKSCIKLSDEIGLNLEVMFYNKVGANKRRLRSEFIVMIIEAARRLGLCLIPAELRTKQAWDHNDRNDDAAKDNDEQEEDIGNVYETYGGNECNVHCDDKGNNSQQTNEVLHDVLINDDEKAHGKAKMSLVGPRSTSTTNTAPATTTVPIPDGGSALGPPAQTATTNRIGRTACIANRTLPVTRTPRQATINDTIAASTSPIGTTRSSRGISGAPRGHGSVDLSDIMPSASLTIQSGYRPTGLQEFIQRSSPDLTLSLERSIHDGGYDIREASSEFLSLGEGSSSFANDSDIEEEVTSRRQQKNSIETDYNDQLHGHQQQREPKQPRDEYNDCNNDVDESNDNDSYASRRSTETEIA